MHQSARRGGIASPVLLASLIGLIFLNACKARPALGPSSLAATGDEQQTAAGPSFIDAFIKTLEDAGVKSLPEALAKVPPEMLQDYSLVHASGSLDRSVVKPDLPRVILASADGRTALAFPGVGKTEDSGEMAEHLELLEFNPATGRESAARLFFYPERTEGPKMVAERDSPVCAACHASKKPKDRRPEHFRKIWDPYPLWNGFYGSVYVADEVETSGSGRYLAKDELAGLKSFLTTNARRGVYASLPGLPTDTSPSALVKFSQELGRRNAAKTVRFNKRNAQRIFKNLTTHPQFGEYMIAIFAASQGIKPAQYFPEHLQSTGSFTTAAAEAETRQFQAAFELANQYQGRASRRLEQLQVPTPPVETKAGVESVAAFLVVTEKMGLSMELWPMIRSLDTRERYLFGDGLFSLQPVGVELVKVLKELAPEVFGQMPLTSSLPAYATLGVDASFTEAVTAPDAVIKLMVTNQARLLAAWNARKGGSLP